MKLKLKRSGLLFMVGIYIGSVVQAQDVELVGVEIAKPPTSFTDATPYNFGTKLTFFVNDTATVTGLTTCYIEEWLTNTGSDMKLEHHKLVTEAVKDNHHIARDTALLSRHDFWKESGMGFSFKSHSWALPDGDTKMMSIKGDIKFTILEPGEMLTEDITHLAGNFGFETMNFDFMGNTIDLKGVTYGKGDASYRTFKGSITNKKYEFAVDKVEFLDADGKVMDTLYFNFSNEYYDSNTRNRVDLLKTAVIRLHYQKIQVKEAVIDTIFGLGF